LRAWLGQVGLPDDLIPGNVPTDWDEVVSFEKQLDEEIRRLLVETSVTAPANPMTVDHHDTSPSPSQELETETAPELPPGLRRCPFGLTPNDRLHQISRKGYDQVVKFKGNQRLWDLLVVFLRESPRGPCRLNDLIHEVWKDTNPEDGTVQGAISDLRKRLRALGITVKHEKGLGYRLQDEHDTEAQ
jgi:hypothetical protein